MMGNLCETLTQEEIQVLSHLAYKCSIMAIVIATMVQVIATLVTVIVLVIVKVKTHSGGDPGVTHHSIDFTDNINYHFLSLRTQLLISLLILLPTSPDVLVHALLSWKTSGFKGV